MEPPMPTTMEAYKRYMSKEPELVHFTDTDGEEHSMSWEDFKTYHDSRVEDDENTRDSFYVELKGVKANSPRLTMAMPIFQQCPLEEAEINARFMTGIHYGEMFMALFAKARKKAIELGINPSHVCTKIME